jgi:hypothetical protein
MWIAAFGGIDPQRSLSENGVALAMFAVSVLMAYVAGVCLWPVYWALEQVGWRGAFVYSAIPMVLGAMIAGSVPQTEQWWFVALGSTCGLFSGLVFSWALRLPNPPVKPTAGSASAP